MDMNLSKPQEMVKDRKACDAAVHRVSRSQTWLSDWTKLITKAENMQEVRGCAGGCLQTSDSSLKETHH